MSQSILPAWVWKRGWRRFNGLPATGGPLGSRHHSGLAQLGVRNHCLASRRRKRLAHRCAIRWRGCAIHVRRDLPTNNKLLAPGRDLSSPETRDLLVLWGRLHAVRTLFSLAAVTIYLLALLLAGKSKVLLEPNGNGARPGPHAASLDAAHARCAFGDDVELRILGGLPPAECHCGASWPLPSATRDRASRTGCVEDRRHRRPRRRRLPHLFAFERQHTGQWSTSSVAA